MKKRGALLLALVLVALATSGCNRPEGGSVPETAPQQLIVYSTFKEEETGMNLSRFSRETDIQAASIHLPAGDIFSRLLSEKDAPRADILYGGSIDMYLEAMQGGLLAPYISPNAADIPEAYKDAEGYFTGVNITYLVIVYNKALIQEIGAQPPQSWQDLLLPEFEGQVAMANPASSGTAYTFLSTMVQLYGEEEGMAYMRRLDANVTDYQKSGAAISRLVAQGEAVVGVSFLHDVLYYQSQGFEDLVAVIPEEGCGYDVGCIGIVAGGPNPGAAQQFIDFALTPASLKAQESAGYYVGYTLAGMDAPQPLAEFGTITTIPNDFIWAGANRARLIETWSAMTDQRQR